MHIWLCHFPAQFPPIASHCTQNKILRPSFENQYFVRPGSWLFYIWIPSSPVSSDYSTSETLPSQREHRYSSAPGHVGSNIIPSGRMFLDTLPTVGQPVTIVWPYCIILSWSLAYIFCLLSPSVKAETLFTVSTKDPQCLGQCLLLVALSSIR